MPDEVIGVEENSPSPLAAAIASSPEAMDEQAQEAQTPAKEEGTQEPAEETRVPYSRFKDVVEEKNWYKQQLEQRLAQQQPQQQTQQPIDQYAGMTPEEEKFWRTQRSIAREEAQKVSQEQFGQIKPVIDAGRNEIAQMKVNQFRAEHPDIKPDSSEEIAIAEKIRTGYLPEDAYRVVMWDVKVAHSEKQANQAVKQKIEAKRQANVEQSSIPSGVKSHVKENLTLRQRIERDAANLDFS